jgi:hypothetical protein
MAVEGHFTTEMKIFVTILGHMARHGRGARAGSAGSIQEIPCIRRPKGL